VSHQSVPTNKLGMWVWCICSG